MTDWQPIETAPRDEEILVYSEYYGVAKAKQWRKGVYEVVTHQTCCLDYYEDVTHWQPLPAPPKDNQ
jgi:hypothetical protein